MESAPRTGRRSPSSPSSPSKQEMVNAFRGDLIAGHQQGDRDGQIERRPVFADVRRGEVDRDPFEGIVEAGVHHGGADPLSSFLHGALRKPHGRERGESVGQIGFDLDQVGVDAEYGGGADPSEHAASTGE